MESYAIEFTKAALKQLRRLLKNVADRIRDKLFELARDLLETSLDVKKLVNREEYRADRIEMETSQYVKMLVKQREAGANVARNRLHLNWKCSRTGKKNGSIQTFKAIARALDVDLDMLT